MYDYLFICSANVGRSQMAQGFYNNLTSGDNSISAAGIWDVGKKYNFRPHPGIIAVMAERGIDISSQRVKMVSEEMLSLVERIILFCDSQKCPEYLQNNPKVEHISITDPYEKNDKEKAFRISRDEIERIVKGLITHNV